MNTISDREHVPPRETCCLSTSYGRPGSTYTPSGNYYSKCVEGPAKAPRKHSSPSLINFGRLFSVNIFARCPRSRFAAFFPSHAPSRSIFLLAMEYFYPNFFISLFHAVSRCFQTVSIDLKRKRKTYNVYVLSN